MKPAPRHPIVPTAPPIGAGQRELGMARPAFFVNGRAAAGEATRRMVVSPAILPLLVTRLAHGGATVRPAATRGNSNRAQGIRP